MYIATLLTGKTYHCYGQLFRREEKTQVPAEMAVKLKSRNNFLVEEIKEAVEEKVPAVKVFTKSELVEMQKDGQIEVLKSLHLNVENFKNEVERLDAIMKAQAECQ